jgi:RNA-binding protein
MQALSSSQRQWLRKSAHDLRPTAEIGRNGLTEQVVHAVNEALAANELIKVKFQDHQDQRQALSATLAEETSSALVGVIGNIAILYRQHPDRERRKIVLPA